MIKLVAGAIGLGLSISAVHAADLAPFAIDILGWSRASSTEIGCRLEKSLGHRDPTFNCALVSYTPATNPCTAGAALYEGPAFPTALAARLHPRASEVEIGFEHGNLRSIFVVLRGAFTPPQVTAALGLPADGKLPENVMSLSVEVSDAGTATPTTRLLIQGFDHLGPGDVDCPASNTPNAPAARP